MIPSFRHFLCRVAVLMPILSTLDVAHADALLQARTLLDRGAFSDALASLPQDFVALDSASKADLQAIRAEALIGEGAFKDAKSAAISAVEFASTLDEGRIADAALQLARVDMLLGDAAQTADLERALSAAIKVDGNSGLRTLKVKDRLALTFAVAGQLPEAEQLIRDTIEQAKDLPADAERDRLRFTNTLGIVLLRRSQFQLSRDAFEAAFEGRRNLLSNEHPETLESEHNLGVALRRLGLRTEADTRLTEVLDLRTKVLGPAHPDTLITRTMIVRQLIDSSHFEAAVRESRAITALLTERVGPRDLRTIEATGDLASALARAGYITEGVATYAQAFRLAVDTMGESNPLAMDTGHEYAGLLYQSGRLAEALGIYQRILRATRSRFSDENHDTLATLHNIAVVLSDLGRLDDAIAAYQYVAGVLDRQVQAAHPDRLSVRNNLALAFLAANRADEALPIIHEVVELRKISLGADNALTLASLSNEAAVLARLRRFDDAVASHASILEIRTRKFGEFHPDTLKSLHNLASTLDEAGRPQEAEPLFRRVVQLRIERIGTGHIETIVSMRGFAGLLMETGRKADAAAIYRQIVDAAEALRVQGGLPDNLRRSYFSTVTPAYKALAILEADAGNFEGAMKAAELSKARTLLELSTVRTATQASLLTAEEGAKLSDLEFRIGRLDSQIPMVADAAPRADLQAQRNELAEAYQNENVRLQSLHSQYRDAMNTHIAGAAELASLLPSGTAFLNFIQSGSKILLLWATESGTHGTQLLEIPGKLSDAIDIYREALAKPEGLDALRYPSNGAPARLVWKLSDGTFRVQSRDLGAVENATIVRHLDDIRDSLSSWILGRLPRDVLKSRNWFISPDGPLSLLPLDSLMVDGHAVVDEHDVSTVQSISMMRISRDRIRSYADLDRQPILVIGDATYAGVAPQPVAEGIGLLRGAIGQVTWPNLPGSARELEFLSERFNLKEGINLLRRQEASRSAVASLQEKGNLARFKYVVFSTHGFLDLKNSDLSGIVLSQVGLNAGDDGYLRASDLTAFNFKSDLVYVSACETGIGQFVSGEGTLGLPFALFAAGNARTILTLWQIFDGGTAEFTDRFFGKLQDGKSTAAALAETKREFLRGDFGAERKSPAYWAPFILYGGAL